jgi:hypothetical protein
MTWGHVCVMTWVMRVAWGCIDLYGLGCMCGPRHIGPRRAWAARVAWGHLGLGYMRDLGYTRDLGFTRGLGYTCGPGNVRPG